MILSREQARNDMVQSGIHSVDIAQGMEFGIQREERIQSHLEAKISAKLEAHHHRRTIMSKKIIAIGKIKNGIIQYDIRSFSKWHQKIISQKK